MTENETRQQTHDLAEMDVIDAQVSVLAYMHKCVDRAVQAAREGKTDE